LKRVPQNPRKDTGFFDKKNKKCFFFVKNENKRVQLKIDKKASLLSVDYLSNRKKVSNRQALYRLFKFFSDN
jgi:hypothetical protein